MRRKFICMLTAIAGLASLNSCKKEKIEYRTPEIYSVVNSYIGSATEINGTDTVYTNGVIVRVTADGDDAVSVLLEDYNKSFSGLEVNESNGTYTMEAAALNAGVEDSFKAAIKNVKDFEFVFFTPAKNSKIIVKAGGKKSVAGNYAGFLSEGDSVYTNDYKVTINGNNDVTFGDFKFENPTVTEKDGAYSITGSVTKEGISYDLAATVKSEDNFTFVITTKSNNKFKLEAKNGEAAPSNLIKGIYVETVERGETITITPKSDHSFEMNGDNHVSNVICTIEKSDKGYEFSGMGVFAIDAGETAKFVGTFDPATGEIILSVFDLDGMVITGWTSKMKFVKK